MNIKMLKAAVAGLVLSVSGFANAGLIDFEGMETYSTSYSASGYEFNFSFSGWAIADNLDSYNNNDTTVLIGQGGGMYVDISLTDGSIFDVSMFDASIMFNEFTSGSLLVTGFLSGGGSIISSFLLTDSYANYSLSGFSGLTSIRFGENGGSSNWRDSAGISIDNIQIDSTQVPEPSTLAIFALGLMGLASRRFKKQS